jgi:hypothetical protein
VAENQNSEYSLLFGDDLSTASVQAQVIELLVNTKIYSLDLARGRLNKVVMVILHKPTSAVVGVVTGSERYSHCLNGRYCHLGVVILPNHGNRPKILERVFKFLRDSKQSHVKGVAIFRKNRKISDNLLRRYKFKPSIKPDLYFRDFNTTG